MEQLTLTDDLPEGYLPCASPHLVEGYVSIATIFKGSSVDFDVCWDGGCDTVFCEHNLDEKREDLSYRLLVTHFRNGGAVNQPLNYVPSQMGAEYGEQKNGHHRLTAAYDAGFTHVPYNSRAWGNHEDWHDTPNAEEYDPWDVNNA
jgi:hypothetical protein